MRIDSIMYHSWIVVKHPSNHIRAGLQSSYRGRESWLLYFNCLPYVSLLFCDSSRGTVAGLQCVIVVFPGHTLVRLVGELV